MTSFPQAMPQPSAPVVDIRTGAFTVTGYRFLLSLWSRTGGAEGASASDCLRTAENLADLPSPAAARTNLGLGSAATHASGDFATAAQGARADTALQAGAAAEVTAVDVGGVQVLGARQTGWSPPSGIVSRAALNTGTATLSQVAQALGALIEDLTTHGLIGP